MEKRIRVRFAPSPTGIMHLGNARAALMNYLYAHQKNGAFILRIEDTDTARNIPQGTEKIIQILSWLGMQYDEGPVVGGPHAPYYQSERTSIYRRYHQELEQAGHLYRCFCTLEELEKMTQAQIAIKQPPRYSRICRNLSADVIAKNLAANKSFIWRFKTPETGFLTVHDLAKGTINFEAHNFSDFPIARQDGSIMFIFSNCIDDIEMAISHVIRGEDHLSNSALQVALYNALNKPIPTFWHLPIMCNTAGQKLSKRDKGFSVIDLINEGFLPHAVANYLAIIGKSFAQEIMSLTELIELYPFDTMTQSNTVTYDFEKLLWINHEWIKKLDPEHVWQHTRLHISPEVLKNHSEEFLRKVVNFVAPEMRTLKDFMTLADPFLQTQKKPYDLASLGFDTHKMHAIITKCAELLKTDTAPADVVAQLKTFAKDQEIHPKILWTTLRCIFAGRPEGVNMTDFMSFMPREELQKRLAPFLN